MQSRHFQPGLLQQLTSSIRPVGVSALFAIHMRR